MDIKEPKRFQTPQIGHACYGGELLDEPRTRTADDDFSGGRSEKTHPTENGFGVSGNHIVPALFLKGPFRNE